MFKLLKTPDAKAICQQSNQKCQKAKQYQKKTYWQKFNESHKQHEKMILYIKIILILGMALMAGIFHYWGFIEEHPDLFGLEMLTYMCCAFAAYVLTCFLRNQAFLSLGFVWGGLKTIVLTALITFLAEVAGLNTKFMHEEKSIGSSLQPENRYREKGLKFKKELWGKMIVGANLAFLTGLALLHLKENDRGSFILLIAGIVVAILSIWIPNVKTFHQQLKDDGWLVDDSDVSNGQIGMVIFFSALFIVFAVVVIVTSIFRYDSFKIYSYFPNNPKMCGGTRAFATVVLFVVETLIVAAMFAVPILYVSSNRNKPELGREYKFSKDIEAFTDFGLLTIKIFLIIVALQMTGFFDSYNKGFCRVDGCNVRLPPNTNECPLSLPGKKKNL